MEQLNHMENIQKSNNRFIDKFEYIVIYMIMYLSSSYVMLRKQGTISLIFMFVLLFLYFMFSLMSGRRVIINSNMAIKMLTLLAIICMGAMSSRGDDTKQTFINVFYILITYMFAMNFEFSKFLRKFNNIIYFLCVFSIVVYFIYIAFPSIFDIFPDVSNDLKRSAKNIFFSTVYGGKRARNQSIFWEPGAFQTYINLALIFDIFYFKNFSKKRLIVYAIAIITTFSTAGYIVALFIVYAYTTSLLMKKQGKDSNAVRNLFFIFTLIFILVLVLSFVDSKELSKVFGKLETYREGGYVSSAKRTTSVSVRFDAFLKPFKIFWEYPVFGAGTRGMNNFALSQRYNMNTCTFVNFFAFFGVLYGMMMMKMFWDFSKRFSKNKIIVFMIFFAIFLATATENYYRNPSILIFVFFPLLKESEDEKNENINKY